MKDRNTCYANNVTEKKGFGSVKIVECCNEQVIINLPIPHSYSHSFRHIAPLRSQNDDNGVFLTQSHGDRHTSTEGLLCGISPFAWAADLCSKCRLAHLHGYLPEEKRN